MELADAVFALQDENKALRTQIATLQGQMRALQDVKPVAVPVPTFNAKAFEVQIMAHVRKLVEELLQAQKTAPPAAVKADWRINLILPVLIFSVIVIAGNALNKPESSPTPAVPIEQMAPQQQPVKAVATPRKAKPRRHRQPKQNSGLTPRERQIEREIEALLKEQP